jgi:serine/threonine protein kinase
MKEMLKARVMHKKSITSVMNELKLLSMISSKFIVNAHYAFQDQENLYLVMDLLLGGDLRFHLAKKKTFTMEQTRFFCACIVHALETVHGHHIIHRDIKPENLVFDDTGYLKLTDFGIAREWMPEIDNSNETSGTPGYMAPEVMCKNNHGIAADYFAIGVIAWECMNGRRPYQGKSRREIRDAILAKQA